MITQGFREGTSRFSATERPRLFPRVSLGSFLIARVHKIVELGQNEQKSSLFCLSRCLASGPKVSLTLWVNDPLKLARQALLCSQGMLETPWGVFLVGHAKSFDLSGVEAM